MALLSQGGTCSPETMASASTRPSASLVDTDSVWAKGCTLASSWASASSSGIRGLRGAVDMLFLAMVYIAARAYSMRARQLFRSYFGSVAALRGNQRLDGGYVGVHDLHPLGQGLDAFKLRGPLGLAAQGF